MSKLKLNSSKSKDWRRKNVKKGDRVVMHTCLEAEKYNGKIWTCETDEVVKGQGCYKQGLVFLKGFSSSFATDYLQKVNLNINKQKAKKIIDIINIHDELVRTIARILVSWDTSKDKKEGMLPEVYLHNIWLYEELTGEEYCYINACKKFDKESGKWVIDVETEEGEVIKVGKTINEEINLWEISK